MRVVGASYIASVHPMIIRNENRTELASLQLYWGSKVACRHMGSGNILSILVNHTINVDQSIAIGIA